jgi:hypothetical protein
MSALSSSVSLQAMTRGEPIAPADPRPNFTEFTSLLVQRLQYRLSRDCLGEPADPEQQQEDAYNELDCPRIQAEAERPAGSRGQQCQGGKPAAAAPSAAPCRLSG